MSDRIYSVFFYVIGVLSFLQWVAAKLHHATNDLALDMAVVQAGLGRLFLIRAASPSTAKESEKSPRLDVNHE